MISINHSVDTGHEDMVHDVQVDYYGFHLATCSSDHSIKLFNLKFGAPTLIDELKGHYGPVWQLSWSHPKYGNILASCSYDRKVIMWKELNGKWAKYYEYANHDSSVNAVQFAPFDYGLVLACGSSDGSISILTFNEDVETWESKKILNAHAIGCNAVSWSPKYCPLSLNEPARYVKRLVSGGCDNLVKIWREVDDQWVEETKLDIHSDWVRDVAWAPSVGLQSYTIASCSQDRRVVIWTSEDAVQWDSLVLQTFDDVVWSVSWSLSGNILAVSGGDNKITLWKQNIRGNWACISEENANSSKS